MKTNLLLVLGVAGGLLGSRLPAVAHLEIEAAVEINSVAQFNEPLTSFGAWVDVPTYGRCWRPARVAGDWRPYCAGYWEWTDCGWYWVSEEPWAWACYHYGRWALTTDTGWVWVPDVVWSPAWVSWREGGGFIGWAPLSPRFRGDVIVGADVAPAAFVFVEENHFHEHHRPTTVIINNTTVINKTTNITNIRTEQKTIANIGTRKVVVNQGPSVAQLSKATGHELRPSPIREIIAKDPPPASLQRKPVPKPEPQQAEKNVPPTTIPTPPKHEVPVPQREEPTRVVPAEPATAPEGNVIRRPEPAPPKHEVPVPPREAPARVVPAEPATAPERGEVHRPASPPEHPPQQIEPKEPPKDEREHGREEDKK